MSDHNRVKGLWINTQKNHIYITIISVLLTKEKLT